MVRMPARLGRYAVRRRIGSGGFATVWLAYDDHLDSPVAIKVLADNWSEDHQVRRRFVEEGRYLRKVESPHVVSVYDAGELDDGRPYLVMSYADQGTLAERLQGEGFTPAQSMEVVSQVGAGLQALHDRDILHRDVKPANVLFRTVESSSGQTVRAMVGDLGLGKALDMSSRLTMVAGTPSYVAPEQAAAQSPDARADQYSLAALAFLLLTGRPPFRYATLAEAMDPMPLGEISTPERPLPDEAEGVLRRGLAPDREDRYDTVTEFCAALRSALGPLAIGPVAQWPRRDPELTQPGPPPSVRRESPAPTETPGSAVPAEAPRRRRGRRALLLGLVALVALAAGGAGGYAAYDRLAPTERTVTDATGSISVTVPADWDRADAPRGWTPPNAEGATFAALSVGSTRSWADAGSNAGGVFAGLLSGTELPQQMPQHPECATTGRVVDDLRDGDQSRTVVYSDCPGGTVVIERVVLVSTNTLLWVQIRSDQRSTANLVLDAVEIHGI